MNHHSPPIPDDLALDDPFVRHAEVVDEEQLEFLTRGLSDPTVLAVHGVSQIVAEKAGWAS